MSLPNYYLVVVILILTLPLQVKWRSTMFAEGYITMEDGDVNQKLHMSRILNNADRYTYCFGRIFTYHFIIPVGELPFFSGQCIVSSIKCCKVNLPNA